MKNEFKLRFFLTVTAFFLISLVSNKLYVRYDATAQKLYTLSPYTITILKNINSTAEITWFKSDNIEVFIPETQYIFDMLKEYQLNSNKNVKVFKKNADVIEQSVLQKLGIISRKIEIKTENGSASKNIYSAIMLEFKGITKIIPFIASFSNLEYELANFILQIESEKNRNEISRKLYFITSKQNEENYIYLKSWLEYSGFILEEPEMPLKELDIRFPIFVAGSEFDADSTSAIEVFLQKKGSAVFFVSGNNIDVKGKWTAKPKTKKTLLKVLQDKGFAVQNNLVLDLLNFKLTMNSADGLSHETINYPFWVTVVKENTKNNLSLFSGVNSLQVFWASEIKIDSDKNIEPFAWTTKNGILMDPPYYTDPFGKALSLFASAEKDKRIIAAGFEDTKTRILVIADENFIGRAIEYTDSLSNLDFAVSCAEWISFKDNLIELKNKKHQILPFKYFEDENEFYSAVRRSRIICFIFIPVLIISIAVYIFVSFGRINCNEQN